tara:strand:- start:10537 stop:11205 length:669 start_codon:yes stop_codon:yes gene_type:complete
MSNCQKIKYCAGEILNHIKTKKIIKKQNEYKMVMLLSDYIEKIVFNYVAIACLISLKAGVNKILDTHIKYLLKYIENLCFTKKKSMKGGAFNTLSFFGGEEPMYTTENIGSDVMNADLENYVARPALYTTEFNQEGGSKYKVKSTTLKLQKCKKVSGILKLKLAKVFKEFNVKISIVSLNLIKHKMEVFLNDMIIKIMKVKKSELTLSTLKKCLSKNIIIKK